MSLTRKQQTHLEKHWDLLHNPYLVYATNTIKNPDWINLDFLSDITCMVFSFDGYITLVYKNLPLNKQNWFNILKKEEPRYVSSSFKNGTIEYTFKLYDVDVNFIDTAKIFGDKSIDGNTIRVINRCLNKKGQAEKSA